MPLSAFTPEALIVSGHDNLRRLQWLRDFSIAAVALLSLLAKPLFYTLLPLTYIFILLAVWIVVSIATWLRLRSPKRVSDRNLLAQLSIDVLMLSALLALSGGPANPLTALYLPTLAMTAAALPALHVWTLTLSCIAAYSLLWKISLPLTVEDVERATQMHLIGMWLTFTAAAILIAGFVAHMTKALRERERQLAHSREQTLRDERIVALGNLAAGAAHELGTPLATMAVLTGELLHDTQASPALHTDLNLLAEQIKACKHIISRLSAHAGITRPEGGKAIQIDHWLEQLVAHWQNLRPQLAVHLEINSPNNSSNVQKLQAAPLIFAETTLEQALLNLFNNAADANLAAMQSGAIEIQAHWLENQLNIDILDRGHGIDPQQLHRVGQEFFSTRSEGIGIGLVLAHAALERHGGQIQLHSRDGGGTRTHIMLPLHSLQIPTKQGS